MAQWIEHPTSNRGVAGSSPARGSNLKFFFVTIRRALVAQWLAHPTSNRGVAGSTPARSALKEDNILSDVAQRKRVWLITRRSLDRN